ncbi:high mobility group protein homolog tdp- [Stylonychia lemnae]|uniref:High mobility group protein homolog tdp n=1 Tax=Stylonychia lemnae TaxID=5949 RepID=A0A078AF82_STYLE|nr:high mobility group protein homolog tdp- [Stylonychia lemnae]|eukprot:CDW79573.1 high mobility group protein homolog tdp- [Stylonychia lemnae]
MLKKKTLGKPKKALNPYLFFVKENRARVGLENPGKSFKEIMSQMSILWSALGQDEKKRYEVLAGQDKVRHEQEIKAFKENPPKQTLVAAAKKPETQQSTLTSI